MKTESPKNPTPDIPIPPDTPVAAVPAPTSAPAKPRAIWHVLRHRDYAMLLAGQVISAGGTQVAVVTIAWQVYLLTHSPVALGLIGLMQAIPRIILSLVGGVLADVFDRRKMLLIVNLLLASTSAVLALTTHLNLINIAIIYAMVLLAAAVSSFEFPTRQALVPTLVPRDELPSALSLNAVAIQLTTIVGTTLGGYLVAVRPLDQVYWIDVVTYFVVIAALMVMVVPRVPLEKRAQAGVAALVDGMRFLKAHPVILSVLSLDFFATFFGSPRALLPVYAGSILHVGAQGLGILLAGTSIGALALTPFTGRVSRIGRQGLGVALAVVAWGLCIIAFGFCTGPLWLSTLFLAGAGAADMISMILRALVIQLTTPDEFRGRISAVNGMFVIGGPMLGQFESGVVGGITTPVVSVVSGGVLCILATLGVLALVPGLRTIRVK